MDEEKKKQLNDAIAVLREECKKHCSCDLCPIGQKIDGKNFAQNLGLGKILINIDFLTPRSQ